MAELSHLSDVTCFDTVLRHLANNPEIIAAINVHEQDLGEVATAFWKDDLQLVESLFLEKKITETHTHPMNAVDVIYLPPFYLFKDRGIKYE
ncbi:MAG TPA: hypothetical protein PK228_10355 [Saprospiraceae bacterium]|nr:hypothetical protein [Saprospiraceae bacterium]